METVVTQNMGRATVGKFLELLREQRGLRRADVAKQIGWSAKQIGRWETGMGELPYLGVRKMLTVLRCPPKIFDALFDDKKTVADAWQAVADLLSEEEHGKHLALARTDPSVDAQIAQLEKTPEGRAGLKKAARRFLEENS
jgi:transcriptional regulator with XRE-family HTH domain